MLAPPPGVGYNMGATLNGMTAGDFVFLTSPYTRWSKRASKHSGVSPATVRGSNQRRCLLALLRLIRQLQ